MAKRVLFVLVLIGLYTGQSVFAQQSKINFRDRVGDTARLVNTAVKPPKQKLPRPLRGEMSGGIRLNTDGYGIFLDKGWLKGGENFGSKNRDRFFHVRLLQFEFIERKHPKEVRSSANITGGLLQPNSYVLGKINNFYAFKVGYGRRQMIAGKPDPGTFSIHWVYLGGFSAGLLKPYYLKLGNLGEQKYSDSIVRDFTNPNMILGRSGFSKGLDEIKFVPGGHVKTGLHVDFSNSKKFLMALEVGVSVEAYTQKIEQMVGQDPRQFFLNFYGSIQFGKRW